MENTDLLAKGSPLSQKEAEAVTEKAVDILGDWVFRIGYRITNNIENSEEISQDTFFALYKEILAGNIEGNIKPWLKTVARNYALMAIRKTNIQSNSIVNLENSGKSDKNYISYEDKEEIFKALDTLSERQKTAVTLKLIENMDYTNIAQHMECNIKTARNHFCLGIRNMRQALSAKEL